MESISITKTRSMMSGRRFQISAIMVALYSLNFAVQCLSTFRPMDAYYDPNNYNAMATLDYHGGETMPSSASKEEAIEEQAGAATIRKEKQEDDADDLDDPTVTSDDSPQKAVVKIPPISISFDTVYQHSITPKSYDSEKKSVSYKISSHLGARKIPKDKTIRFAEHPRSEVGHQHKHLDSAANVEDSHHNATYEEVYPDTYEGTSTLNDDDMDSMPQTTNNGYMPDQKMSGGQNHGYQSSPSYIETKDNKITEKLRKMVPKAIRKRFQREDKTAWGKVKKAGRVVKRAVVEGAKYIKKAVQRAAKAVKHKINTGRWKPSRVLSDYE